MEHRLCQACVEHAAWAVWVSLTRTAIFRGRHELRVQRVRVFLADNMHLCGQGLLQFTIKDRENPEGSALGHTSRMRSRCSQSNVDKCQKE